MSAFRRPYQELFRRIVEEQLEPCGPPLTDVLEVGSGSGGLREILPPEWRRACIHTDPDTTTLEQIRKLDPATRTVQAAIERLPAEDGTTHAVLASCVFDVVPDLEAAAREVRRVLRPGGSFLHFVDMQPSPRHLLPAFAQQGLVVFPSFSVDGGEQHWPADLVVSEERRLQITLQALKRFGHPAAQVLEDYLALWEAPSDIRFDDFVRLTDDAASVAALARTLVEIRGWAEDVGLDSERLLRLRPLSSTKLLSALLAQTFEAEAFQIELNEIRIESSSEPRTDGDAIAYRSLCTGQGRELREPPPVGLRGTTLSVEPGYAVAELGVFVFHARAPVR